LCVATGGKTDFESPAHSLPYVQRTIVAHLPLPFFLDVLDYGVARRVAMMNDIVGAIAVFFYFWHLFFIVVDLSGATANLILSIRPLFCPLWSIEPQKTQGMQGA